MLDAFAQWERAWWLQSAWGRGGRTTWLEFVVQAPEWTQKKQPKLGCEEPVGCLVCEGDEEHMV